jgi:hypothetical protein
VRFLGRSVRFPYTKLGVEDMKRKKSSLWDKNKWQKQQTQGSLQATYTPDALDHGEAFMESSESAPHNLQLSRYRYNYTIIPPRL